MRNLNKSRVLVVGAGTSGRSATRLLLEQGARVTLTDRRTVDELPDAVHSLAAMGASLVLGGHDPSTFASADLIVVSPGVGNLEDLTKAQAQGIEIISEVELASWYLRSTLVAVTGTNGKSTVVSLIGDMCSRSGQPTFVGGNLGTPLSDAVDSEANHPEGFAVVELSSFQLERVQSLRPRVAVLLNVAEDHLDRYESFAHYAAAKGRIFSAQQPSDAAVVPDEDEVCLALARTSQARLFRFGGTGRFRLEGRHLVNGTSSFSVDLGSTSLSVQPYATNACAAALASHLVGVSHEHIEASLRGFRGLPHRLEALGQIGGVLFYDDSKATNVSAAVAAVEGVASSGQRVVLIAGGRDKGGSYQPLAQCLRAHARALVLLGEAAPAIERAMRPANFTIAHAASMEEAVDKALHLALAGDAILLAPACASFDMFPSYTARGEAYQRAVATLRGASHA